MGKLIKILMVLPPLLGTVLIPPPVFPQEALEDTRPSSPEQKERDLVKEAPPPEAPNDNPVQVEAPARPPRKEPVDPPKPPLEAPTFDPCRRFAKHEKELANCRSCSETLFGKEASLIAYKDRNAASLLNCCIEGLVTPEDLNDWRDNETELVQECRCAQNPSVLTCMGCLSEQQVNFMGSCYEELTPEQVIRRVKFEAMPNSIARISFIQDETQYKRKAELKEGLEAPGERPRSFAEIPLCDCPSPGALAEPEPVCHKDFATNILSYPCLHPSQEDNARTLFKQLLTQYNAPVSFESLEYNNATQEFEAIFMAPPSMCEQMRYLNFGRSDVTRAVVTREVAKVRDIKRVPLEKADIETPESCLINIPECRCDEPGLADADGPDGEIVEDRKPNDIPVVREEGDERLFVCVEDSVVAVDVETCQLIWLGDGEDKKCPQIPVELSLDSEMAGLAKKVESCERGETISLNSSLSQFFDYVKAWKSELDLPHPPIRAFRFSRNIGGEPFAKTSKVQPHHVTMEDPPASENDPVIVGSDASQTPFARDKIKVRIRVEPPFDLPEERLPIQNPVNPGPGLEASAEVSTDTNSTLMSNGEATAAIEDQLARVYLLVPTGYTGSKGGGGCSLIR